VSIRILLTCFFIFAASAGPARAEVPFTGTEFFRFALYKQGLKPITDREWKFEFQRHQDMIVVIVGDTSDFATHFPGGLRDFVDKGGAVLIASGRPHVPQFANGPDDWRAAFGITMTGTPVFAAPRKGYGGDDQKPFIKPLPRVLADSPSPFDLFNGVEIGGTKGIATDRPSEMLSVGAARLTVKNLAAYADGSRKQNAPLDAAGNHFAISLEPSNGIPGRVIVLANSNVFANGMMGFKQKPDGSGDYETDNDNWEFAKRTIDWLQGGYPQKRTQCLFIENGRIIDKFADERVLPPKPPIPDIPPDVLANILLNHSNGLIREAEEQNFFNRMIEGLLGFPRLVRMFLVIVTVVFALFALRWLARGARKAEPSATITKNVQAGLLPRGGVLKQRTAAQIEVGNLYEAARRRVRSRFDILGGRPGSNGKMPPVLTANDLPDGPLIYQTIRWLWTIGYGDTPLTVPPGEWDRLNALLERVSSRAARGDWSFGQDI
jgi:hypothetical protein